MFNWDYKLPKNWQPKTDEECIWYLNRTINYGLNNNRLNLNMVKKYFYQLNIEPNKKFFLQFLLKKYENQALQLKKNVFE